nr:hypothetical protein [Haladaptatus sp. DYSN1]
MTADRLRSIVPMFGGATQYIETLDATLAFVDSSYPTTDELVAWHQETFANVSSRSSIMRRMGYLTNLGFLQRDGEKWTLGAVGEEYTQNHDTATLFRVMSDRNVGLRSLLYALAVAPMTIMEISDQQLDTHPELGWRRGEPDMALQRANWLRSMGLVEKQGDEYQVTRDGRAFVKDVESPNDVGLFFVAVNDEWLTRFKTSVVRPFKLAGRANVPSQLEGADSVRVWGTTATDSAKKQAAIDRLKQDDVVLFYHAGAFIGAGTVGRVFESQTVGDWLWNNPESRHIYTLNDYREDVPTVEEVRSMLGYKNDRFVNSSLDPVAEEKVGELVRQYGSLEAALFGSPVQEISEPTEDEIQAEQSLLARALDSEATIIEDKTQYTIQKRKARDAAFRRLVKLTIISVLSARVGEKAWRVGLRSKLRTFTQKVREVLRTLEMEWRFVDYTTGLSILGGFLSRMITRFSFGTKRGVRDIMSSNNTMGRRWNFLPTSGQNPVLRRYRSIEKSMSSCDAHTVRYGSVARRTGLLRDI